MPQTKKSSAKNTKKAAAVKGPATKNLVTKAPNKKMAPAKKGAPVKKATPEEDREIILPPVNEDKILDDGEVPVVEAVEADLLVEESEDEESDLDTFGDSWEE